MNYFSVSSGRPRVEDAFRGRAPAYSGVLLVLLLAHIAIFVLFYPPLAAIEDEAGFLNQTFVWSRGAVSAEGAGFDYLADFIPRNGRYVSWRNPGRSLIMLPFYLLGGPDAVRLSGLLIHLAITLVSAYILAGQGLPVLWAALVLFHPTLLIYSRTALGDAPAGLFLLLAFLMLLRPNASPFTAGLLVGAAALMRYHAGLVAPFVWLTYCPWKGAAEFRRSLKFAAGVSIFACAIFGWNLLLLDNLTGFVGQGNFNFEYFPRQAGFYLLALMLIYPLMLPAPWFCTGRLRRVALSLTVPIFVLFCGYYFHDRGRSVIETLVLGQRLVQAALPIWVVCYAIVIHRSVWPWIASRYPTLRRIQVPAAGCVLLLLTAGQVAIFLRHQNYLQRLKQVRDAVIATVPEGSTVVANTMVSKLFAAVDPRLPSYRWLATDYQGHLYDFRQEVAGATPAYLAMLPKSGEPLDARPVELYGSTCAVKEVRPAGAEVRIWRMEGCGNLHQFRTREPAAGTERPAQSTSDLSRENSGKKKRPSRSTVRNRREGQRPPLTGERGTPFCDAGFRNRPRQTGLWKKAAS